MKIAIVGSKNYSNEYKLKRFIFRLKQRYNDDLIILGCGGVSGVDIFVKRICKWQLNIKYIEFLPVYSNWNGDCEGSGLEHYMYNKQYNPKYIHSRNIRLVKSADLIIGFSVKNDNIEQYNTIFKFAKKEDKKYIIFAE